MTIGPCPSNLAAAEIVRAAFALDDGLHRVAVEDLEIDFAAPRVGCDGDALGSRCGGDSPHSSPSI